MTGMFISLLALLFVGGLSSIYQWSSRIWVPLLGLTWFFLLVTKQLHFIFAFITLFVLIPICVFAWSPALRRSMLISKIFHALKQKMPPISATEREAIESGHTWWERELFLGIPNWEKLSQLPTPKLTEEEIYFLENQVETLCKQLNDWEIVQAGDLPQSVWDYLKRERFFGLVSPKEYGGLGFSATAHSTIVGKISARSSSAAVTVMVPNSLGPAELIIHYGTDAQKNYYLPRLAKGEEIPCFALTGLEAGSDAGSITDTGEVCYGDYQGKSVLGLKLNFAKRYITLAPVATLVGVAVHVYDPNHLLGDKTDCGITLCLLSSKEPGMTIGLRHNPLYMAFMNGPIYGKDVFIPLDQIIGGQERIGQGWRMLMESLSIGRSISLPALSAASTKLVYLLTGGYSKARRQFGLSISQFEGVAEKLSQMAGMMYLAESTRLLTTSAVDQGIRPGIASAITKYHLTEISRTCIQHAMDVHGGHGIQVGPRNSLAHAHISIPVSITVEGANILTRNLMIYGQGVIRCHPFLLQEIQLLNAASPDFERFDKLLMEHVSSVIRHVFQASFHGLTGGYFVQIKKQKYPAIKRAYQQLSRMSLTFSVLTNMALLVLGGNLKRRERISSRLGDILSHLYMASASLKYFQDAGERPDHLPSIQWCLAYCLHHCQEACDELFNNFPSRILGKILSWVCFPWGRLANKPQFNSEDQLLENMLTTSAFREEMTRHIFVGENKQDTLVKIQTFMKHATVHEAILKRLMKAQREGKIPEGDILSILDQALEGKWISEDEKMQFEITEKLRRDIMQVDEFEFDHVRGVGSKAPASIKF